MRLAESLSAMQALHELSVSKCNDLLVNISGIKGSPFFSHGLPTVWFVLGTVDSNVTAHGIPLSIQTELKVCIKSTLGFRIGSYTSQSQPGFFCLKIILPTFLMILVLANRSLQNLYSTPPYFFNNTSLFRVIIFYISYLLHFFHTFPLKS